MNKKDITLNSKVFVSVPKDLETGSGIFINSLKIIDNLYCAQTEGEEPGSLRGAEERDAWAHIITTLSGGSDFMPQGSKETFKKSLLKLKRGIYDLYPLTVLSGDQPELGIELILGKVFLSAGHGMSYYGGASGVINNDYNGLIKKYDEYMPVFSENLGALDGGVEIEAPGDVPELRCLDVFSLAGGLNRPHKPICVFFSGGGKENVSSLSNMTVFINLYRTRFKEITQRISEHYLPWASDALDEIGDREVSRLLLIWLRGHDIGHFLGVDRLGKVMSEFDMDYMILHELKSDYISLFNMRYLDPSVFGLAKEQAYAAAVSEMLRYVRRGGIYKHPDSGSAYLTYMALTESGALQYDKGGGTYTFDQAKFEKTVLDCTQELLGIFSSGSAQKARAYVSRWGRLQEADQMGIPRSCPEELSAVINDPGIARLIEYSFVF